MWNLWGEQSPLAYLGKAQGLDRVLNLPLKIAIAEAPELFKSAMQKCLGEGVFSEVWKRQSLIFIIAKGGKPPGDPTAYRSTCLIYTAVKVLEMIIHM